MVERIKPKNSLPKLNDQIGFAADLDLMQLINDDILLYANTVKKANKYGLLQARTIAITDKAIYNIHKKRLKSTIKMDNILGITKKMPSGNEFCIHVK